MKEKQNMELSIVIPIQNAGGSLRELIHRCLATCRRLGRSFEIILVDDNSIDGSATMIIKAAKKWEPEVKALLLSHDHGKNGAAFAGLARSRGKVVIILEADLQNPPEEIPQLIQELDKDADMVSTIRLRRHEKLLRWFFSSLINSVARWAIGVKMHDPGSLFMACRRPVVEAMLQSGKRSVFIPLLAHSFSDTIIEVPVRYNPLPRGYSSYSYRDLLNLLLDLPTAICALPLRVFTFMAILLTGCDLLFIACFLMIGSGSGITWAARHVTFLFILLFMIIGGQFLGLGMFAKYVSWFYRQSEKSPRLAGRKNNFGIRNGQLINT
jgi:undecaprenyl-phosphate 4-deoxy-4-formamido-L-arabinose transferase